MSSMARYIASTRSKVIANASKVQYTKFTVSADTLNNGVVPCPRISFNEIIYKPKPCCTPKNIEKRITFDGGNPYRSGPRTYDGGRVFSAYDGGNPSSNGLINYEGGNPSSSGRLLYDGGLIFSSREYDGGDPLSSGSIPYDGGNPSSMPTLTYNGGSV
jgi:hypothetical protein